MPSVRDLRDRIKSLKNTQQITKAMKQVAAAKIRRAEVVQRQARPYAEALTQMLQDLMDAVGAVDHPFLKPGAEGTRQPDCVGDRRRRRVGSVRADQDGFKHGRSARPVS